MWSVYTCSGTLLSSSSTRWAGPAPPPGEWAKRRPLQSGLIALLSMHAWLYCGGRFTWQPASSWYIYLVVDLWLVKSFDKCMAWAIRVKLKERRVCMYMWVSESVCVCVCGVMAKHSCWQVLCVDKYMHGSWLYINIHPAYVCLNGSELIQQTFLFTWKVK